MKLRLQKTFSGKNHRFEFGPDTKRGPSHVLISIVSSTMAQPSRWSAMTLLFSLCVIGLVYNMHSNSLPLILKGVKYACTNSVDCLNVPTEDKDDDESPNPSDFLKNIVSEIASEDYMPQESDRYLEMAQELADVGVKEMNNAKQLREAADLDDEKAKRLEKTMIQLSAAYNSKKSIALWYQDQAKDAQKIAQNQLTSLRNLETQDKQLSKKIKNQAEIMKFVDHEKSITPSAKPSRRSGSNEWQSVVLTSPLDSPEALQKVFEQGGKITSR